MQFKLSAAALAGSILIMSFASAAQRNYTAMKLRAVTKLAQEGNTSAEFELARREGQGIGVQKNYKQAIHWLRESADHGNAEAEWKLGQLYYLGNGVARDYRKAVGWFRKAADQGNAKAEVALGASYYLSVGVPRDYGRAAKWWRLAARQGDTTAEAALARMHKSCLHSQHGELYAASVRLVNDARGISRMKGIFQAEIDHMLPTARRVYKKTGIVPPALYDIEASEQQAVAGMMVRERVDWHNYKRLGGTATSPAAVRAPRDPCAKWRE